MGEPYLGLRMGAAAQANILLVDDQPENLLALEAILAPLGQRVVLARSGVEALKQLLLDDFAVILLDVQMPGLDGFRTAACIKQREKTKNLPIIFITAISKERHQVFQGYTAGGVDYVFKPLDQDILRSKVQVFVDLHLKNTALHESEERFRKAFEDAPIGIGLINPDRRWLRVNRALCEITGYTEEHLLGRSFEEMLHPEDRPGNAHHFREVLAGESSSYRLEKRMLHASGHFVWVMLSVSRVRDVQGRPLYLIAQLEDITERKRAEVELVHQAHHDALTGLPNRALFLDRLDMALRRLERRPSSVAVLFLDVDRFKVVNDSLGHETGDELLVALARRLQAPLRPSDTVARFGGDELTILCEDTVERDAVTVAQRILGATAEPFHVAGRDVYISISIGIVIATDRSSQAVDLIRDADAAMYRAKDKGKARYELFDDRMRARAMERLATENALHRALERGELCVYYQPTWDLPTGQVQGFEALVRWQHPERGLIPPGDFIPLAEETALILPLGEWVLNEACRQARQWCQAYPDGSLDVAVNLSARQFAQPDLGAVVARALAQAELDPSRLCLEVTETVLMDDSDQTLAILAELKRLGVRLSIDDFGTGYSSLNYLKRFDADILKVDRCFVDGVRRGSDNSAILGAIARLADALGLTAVAEGVETRAQLVEVRRLGFRSAQGYYLGRPQPADAIRGLIETRAKPTGSPPRRRRPAGHATSIKRTKASQSNRQV